MGVLSDIITGSQLICEYIKVETVGESFKGKTSPQDSFASYPHDVFYNVDHPFFSVVGKSCLNAKFHQDWNWIIPVARKAYAEINELIYDRTEMRMALAEFDVYKVFEVTVNYIKIINKHSKQNG